MIFCHTKASAKWLANKMHQEGYVVALLSGELDVTQRATILKRFRDGKERVLVTTNVCARGIDVEQVTLVVNFDLPMTKVSFSISKFQKFLILRRVNWFVSRVCDLSYSRHENLFLIHF